MARDRVQGDMLRAEVHGLPELLARLQADKLVAVPLRRFWSRLGITGVNIAKELTPVDRGRLRASEAHEVSTAKIPDFVRIGPNVRYGGWVHDGRKPGGKFPPLAPIKAWAKRHGMPESAAFPIARKIAQKGIKERPFLTDALPKILDRMPPLMTKLGDEIKQNWEK